jgi:hypothetical protein
MIVRQTNRRSTDPRTGAPAPGSVARRSATKVGSGPAGIQKDVTFVEEAAPTIHDQIDGAYRSKYRRYAANIIGSVVSLEARSATIKLVPRATTQFLMGAE